MVFEGQKKIKVNIIGIYQGVEGLRKIPSCALLLAKVSRGHCKTRSHSVVVVNEGQTDYTVDEAS